jgi:hypothetical protein
MVRKEKRQRQTHQAAADDQDGYIVMLHDLKRYSSPGNTAIAWRRIHAHKSI